MRKAGVVGGGVRGSSYAEVLENACRRGELRGTVVAMELGEERTYAWLLEPLLEVGGLSSRWRVARHGFGPTLDTMYEQADGVVVLQCVDGRRLEAQADPRWEGRWYDHDLVERFLAALMPELPAAKAFYAVGCGLPPEESDLEGIWTVLDPAGASLLREVGLDVRRVDRGEAEAP